jgi:predicted Zn-dependent peptidase
MNREGSTRILPDFFLNSYTSQKIKSRIYYPAVDRMNYMLGGGSFSSRITKVVRTDK